MPAFILHISMVVSLASGLLGALHAKQNYLPETMGLV
jgi:hypothetical protein